MLIPSSVMLIAAAAAVDRRLRLPFAWSTPAGGDEVHRAAARHRQLVNLVGVDRLRHAGGLRLHDLRRGRDGDLLARPPTSRVTFTFALARRSGTTFWMTTVLKPGSVTVTV
jgi:hypothetical protein